MTFHLLYFSFVDGPSGGFFLGLDRLDLPKLSGIGSLVLFMTTSLLTVRGRE